MHGKLYSGPANERKAGWADLGVGHFSDIEGLPLNVASGAMAEMSFPHFTSTRPGPQHVFSLVSIAN
jgi:hypothetical protein